MLQGLYTAAAGMLAQQNATDANANNLANAGTTGFRRQLATINAIPRAYEDPSTGYTANDPLLGYTLTTVTSSDAANGAIRLTGNPADLALRGDGFFVIQHADGQDALTRDGSFQLDSDGRLSTSDGWLVQGERGAITIDRADWRVDQEGRVFAGGQLLDTLQIVRPSASAMLTRVGDTRWTAESTEPAPSTLIEQGALESSNVNTVAEMVALITATRSYEANQKCIQAFDSILDRAVNEIGRTA